MIIDCPRGMHLHAAVCAASRQNARAVLAFTLIELLVVIAVIALLVSILLPALSAARESGRQAQCLSNIRQLAIAAATHANDFKGAYSTGPFDDRPTHGNGPLEEKGWVADFVLGGYAVPGRMLCPSSPSRSSQALSRNGRLHAWAQRSLSDTALVDKLIADGFNTNYCQSWFMGHTAPKDYAATGANLKLVANTVGPLNEKNIGPQAPVDRVPLFGDATTDVSANDDSVFTSGGVIRGAKTITDGPTIAFIPGRGALWGRQDYTDFGPSHGKGGFSNAFGHDRVYGAIGFADGHAAVFAEKKPDKQWGHDTGYVVNGVSTIRYHELEGKVYGGWLNKPGLPF
jgi:prepilin-type N-terminal cleavage/methylation domain-containing protein